MKTSKSIASTLSLLAIATAFTFPLKPAVAQTSNVVVVNGVRIATGSTPEGFTNWRQCLPVSLCGGIPSILVDVDTSRAGFTRTPNYVTSIGGGGVHGLTNGATAIYGATPKGFTVGVYFLDKSNITPQIANGLGWRINWMGMSR